MLEERYEERLEDHAAELAQHFAHSSDPADLARAVAYGEKRMTFAELHDGPLIQCTSARNGAVVERNAIQQIGRCPITSSASVRI